MKYGKMKAIKAVTAMAMAGLLAGCAMAPMSVNRYSNSENLETQTLAEGTVIRTMPITIAFHKNQSDNGMIGMVGGAGVGYALSATPWAAIGGALLGGIVGHDVTPGSVKGTDVMVKLTDGQMIGVPEVGNPHLHSGEQVVIMRGPRGRTRAVPLH